MASRPQLTEDSPSAERRDPGSSSAVAGIDQGLRVRSPDRLDAVACRMRESARLAVVQVAEPEVPVSFL